MVPGTKITGITWRGGTTPSARAWKLLGLHIVSKPGSPFSSKLSGTRRVACGRGGVLLILNSPRRWLWLNDVSRGDAIRLRGFIVEKDVVAQPGVVLGTLRIQPALSNVLRAQDQLHFKGHAGTAKHA